MKKNSAKVITVAAVLHNIAIECNDAMPLDTHPSYHDEEEGDDPQDYVFDIPEDQVSLVNCLTARERRIQGCEARNQ